MKQLYTIVFVYFTIGSLWAESGKSGTSSGFFKIASCTPIANNTVGNAQTICNGATPATLSGSVPTGGDGLSYTYTWISSLSDSMSGFAPATGTNNTMGYAPGAVTQTTWFRRIVSSGICPDDTSAAITIEVDYPITNNTITGNQVVFNGFLPGQLIGAVPAGGDGSGYSYLWIISNSPTGSFDSIRRSNNNSQHYQPDTAKIMFSLTNYPIRSEFYHRYKRIVRSGVCKPDTSNPVEVIVSDTLYWTGVQDNDWNNTLNWVGSQTGFFRVIPSSSSHNPVITGEADIHRLRIDSGKTVSLLDSNSTLYIGDYFYGNGTYDGSSGTTIYDSQEYLQGVYPGTYNKLEVRGYTRSEMGGTVLVKRRLTATTPIDLWGQLILDSNCVYSLPWLIRMAPLSTVSIRNIGAGGRSGNVIFPVESRYGSCKNVTINNAGIADAFTIQCLDTIKSAGLTGAKITANTIKNGWVISEGVAGGSNVTLTMQWDTGVYAEYPGFSPSASYIAFYDGGLWNSTVPSPAVTALGKRTQIRSGLTIFNNTPFSVGSNATIPVRLIAFDAVKQDQDVVLTWTTANELNNDRFEIQRSYDGKHFKTIGLIKGGGTTSLQLQYSYKDADVAKRSSGTVYYRLVQVDFNGGATVSDMIRITWAYSQEITVRMDVYPNPFADHTTVFVTQQYASTGTLIVTDLMGKEVLNKTIQLNSGVTEIELEGLNFKEGLMIVTVISGEGIATSRLMKY